jgi:SRSO17 transposase
MSFSIFFAPIQGQKLPKFYVHEANKMKKKLGTSNIYSSMQQKLKYKQQINNSLLRKNRQSEMSFSLSSSNTSSTSMKSLKDETFPLGPIKLFTQSESRTSH